MDVTLLLNQSAGLASCKEDSRESTPPYVVGGTPTAPSTALPTPSPDRSFPHRDGETRQGRGRTPWSAGGYSLPMHSDSKFRSTSTFSHRSASEQFDSDASGHTATGTSIHSRTGSTESDMISSSRESSTLPRPQPSRSSTTDAHSRPAESLSRRTPSWDERRAFDGDAPMPPRHKFSDSHSSLSSYGSWQSRSHSRISSVTTVSGGYTGGSSLAELPILESNLPEREEPKTRPAHREERPSLSLTTKLQPPVIAGVERPKSPSDAVLNMKGLARPQPNVESLRTPLSRASHLFSSPKLHKRAISAPDFASASGSLPSRMHPYTVLPPPHQVMGISATSSPPGARSASSAVAAAARERLEGRELGDVREVESEQRGRKLSTARTSATPGGLVPSPDPGFHAVAAAAAQQGEEAMGSKSEEAEPHCMFVANCDTGSQLRKAISHLFGRNKSCTLKIPKEVWVYYCRKHYQRIRYRNARTYPSNQMELVKVQIRRLQSWSEGNQAKGEGPYIKQWTLSLRKREQNRLESGKGSVEEGGDDDHLGGQGGSVVPEWIIQLVGDGYPTDKMLEIAERLHKDITDGVLSQVPEIEFLPDIVDDDEGGSSRPARTRRQNSSNGGSKTPKRKAAADFPDVARQGSMHDEGVSPLMPQPGDDEDASAGLVSPSGKRARIDRFHEGPEQLPPVAMGRPVPAAYMGYGGDGRGVGSAPPRAPNVVPKFRPMEYHQAEPRFGPFPHGLGALYDDAVPALGGHHHHHHHHAHHHHTGGRYHGGGHGSADLRLTLPSISTQMSSSSSSSSPSGIALRQHPMMSSLVHAPRRSGHGPARPTHQRSASAYTPTTRPSPASARPSSSGNSAQQQPGDDLGDVGAAAAMYELDGHHHHHHHHAAAEPPHVAFGYGHEQGWPPAYGAPHHGFAPARAPGFHPAHPQPLVYGHGGHCHDPAAATLSPRSAHSYAVAGTSPTLHEA